MAVVVGRFDGCGLHDRFCAADRGEAIPADGDFSASGKSVYSDRRGICPSDDRCSGINRSGEEQHDCECEPLHVISDLFALRESR
jgi:hypothetical protein